MAAEQTGFIPKKLGTGRADAELENSIRPYSARNK